LGDGRISTGGYIGQCGQPYNLVFSDKIEIENRPFYPGDDTYWAAVNLWYDATNDLEWYI